MYGLNVLDGSNSEYVHVEASAWLAVMDSLANFVDGVDRSRQDEARKQIEAARTALELCKGRDMGFADAPVANARTAIRATLAFFPDKNELVDGVFFVAVSTSGVGDLVERAEELDPKKLTKEERQEIGRALESVIDSMDAKFEEMQKDLEEAESENTDDSENG